MDPKLSCWAVEGIPRTQLPSGSEFPVNIHTTLGLVVDQDGHLDLVLGFAPAAAGIITARFP